VTHGPEQLRQHLLFGKLPLLGFHDGLSFDGVSDMLEILEEFAIDLAHRIGGEVAFEGDNSASVVSSRMDLW
jgi:hypothetical protein